MKKLTVALTFWLLLTFFFSGALMFIFDIFSSIFLKGVDVNFWFVFWFSAFISMLIVFTGEIDIKDIK